LLQWGSKNETFKYQKYSVSGQILAIPKLNPNKEDQLAWTILSKIKFILYLKWSRLILTIQDGKKCKKMSGFRIVKKRDGCQFGSHLSFWTAFFG
jgi:hypothetical protein